MAKNLMLMVAVPVLALSVGTARAGDYHRLTTLICSDCHTMHYSVSHNFTNGDAPPPNNLSGGPNQRLLKAATPNDLCKSCHDGQTFAPDAVGANTGTHVREAGGLTTGITPYENWKGHTIGAASAGVTAPGGTWNAGTTGLQCTNCHSAHGGALPTPTTGLPADIVAQGQWRNLTSRPGTTATTARVRLAYAKGLTNNPDLEIWEKDGTLGQIPVHYSIDNVTFNKPVAAASNYGQWCKGCHTDFHGAATDPNMHGATDFIRHPTAGVSIPTTATSRWTTAGPNKVKVLVGSAANDFTPSCMSCHKSHGNQNAFGLIYMKGTGPITEEGDDDGTGRNLGNLCQQCHSQGT